MTEVSLTEAVKSIAREEGFARVGVAPADVSFDESAYRAWLAEGFGADMAYLTRDVHKRHKPGQLVENARSIICLAVSYAPAAEADGDPFIARYARGRDYHKVLKRRCHRLMDRLRRLASDFAGRAFVDTAPLAERSLAAVAGLGWIGRNGCLIAGELGSYVVLCEIICNLPLETVQPPRQAPDGPDRPGCGDCRLCVEACPTGAIVADGIVDARVCRSYLTIEHRRAIDAALWPKMDSCVFGCDVCQAVCPHNRGLAPGDEELACPELVERAGPGDAAGELALADVLAWSEADWDAATRGSAMRRATYEMFVRNAVLAAGNSGDDPFDRLRAGGLVDALIALQAGRADLAAEVAWALQRIARR